MANHTTPPFQLTTGFPLPINMHLEVRRGNATKTPSPRMDAAVNAPRIRAGVTKKDQKAELKKNQTRRCYAMTARSAAPTSGEHDELASASARPFPPRRRVTTH